MILKVCGIRDNIDEVAALEPGYMGFIFYKKSKRYVGEDFNPSQLKNISSKTKKVAVFVNEDVNKILETINHFGFDAVQLHGDETPVYCQSLHGKGFEVIKTFGIDEKFDFEKLSTYVPYCDYFLFDTKSESYGGTGQQFNHELLKKYRLQKPFFLSGGIGVDEVQQLNSSKVHQLKEIYAVDVNSKIEIKPGLKDINKLKQLCSIL